MIKNLKLLHVIGISKLYNRRIDQIYRSVLVYSMKWISEEVELKIVNTTKVLAFMLDDERMELQERSELKN